MLDRKAEAWSDADVRTVVGDLREPGPVIEAIENEIEPGRSITALLNIAGIYEDTSPGNFDVDVALDILRINLLAPQVLSFGLWKRFTKNGCIVNAGFVAISRHVKGAATYTAGKRGLLL